MKAFILAAGSGTRLRPLTENLPKVMVEVAGEKILERTIRQLKEAGVADFVINTSYLPEAVTNYFGSGKKWGVNIEYSHEPVVLGTAGGLKNVEHKFKDEEEFLVVYGDNIFDLDFKAIIDEPLEEDSHMIVLFDRRRSPNSGIAGGVVEVNEQGKIVAFHEGVDKPEIFLVNSGVYKFKPEIFKHIPEGEFYDFGKQVFPSILEKAVPLQAYIIKDHEALFGVDNLECLEKAEQYLKLQIH